MSGEAYSQQQPSDIATEYATIQFVVQSILSRIATATLVKIVSCTNIGDLSPWGTVTVQPLVSQMSGNNVAVQYPNLFRLPYMRLQGGTNAVIIDPVVGDIGLAVFCARDISSLKDQVNIDKIKSDPKMLGVPPASGRQYNMADGIYIGGMLNAQPVQYVRFSSTGVEIVSPTKIKLQAPQIEIAASTSISVASPSNAISGGGTTVDGKTFLPHTHSGVQPGSGVSGGVT
jgi:hypothetical protein